jgi:transposase
METERKPHPGGRPTLLTAERQQTILDLIAAGNYIDTATKAAGISHQTLYNWIARGTTERERLQVNPDAEPDPKEQKYLEFLEESEKAFAIAEARNMAIIQRAAHDGTWQAAAWILERTRGKRYQRVDKSEISGPEGGPLRISVSTEELERKVSRILEKRESA